MTVAAAVIVHLRCHASTIVFESPGWLRSSRINDGGARSSRSFVRPFRDAGRQHRSARKFANCRDIGQSNYAWLCASSTLGLDIRLPCVEALIVNQASGDEIQCAATPVPGHWEASSPSITRHGSNKGAFMLRIERSANGQVVFTLSGRMQTEDIEQFQQLLVVETLGQQLMFNLRDVTLVNQDAVTFLADCEANGIKLESCPLHIRNWIDQEKRRNKRRRRQKRDT